jgi:hypothetical protein
MSRRTLGLAVIGVGVVAVALVACGDSATTVNYVGNTSCPTSTAQPYGLPGVNGDHTVGQAIDEMPHFHVPQGTQIQFNHDPPTSGCHYSIPSQAPVPVGAYDREIPAEYWVHNLEHGYIVVLYNCPSGCDSDFQKLVAWRKTLPPDPGGKGAIPYTKVVVLPWHSMPRKFAAVSWDYYIGWDSLDISKVQEFYDNHVGQAPEGAMTP